MSRSWRIRGKGQCRTSHRSRSEDPAQATCGPSALLRTAGKREGGPPRKQESAWTGAHRGDGYIAVSQVGLTSRPQPGHVRNPVLHELFDPLKAEFGCKIRHSGPGHPKRAWRAQCRPARRRSALPEQFLPPELAGGAEATQATAIMGQIRPRASVEPNASFTRNNVDISDDDRVCHTRAVVQNETPVTKLRQCR
jgi:hypothetical protein